jgi:phosphoribosylformimino-5-aminoimidazole carboxamide ribonucleotide (ProFAR) isomerase
MDPVMVTRDLLDAAQQPVAVEFGCAGSKMARDLIDAGAKKVVLSDEALLRPSLVRDLAMEIGSDATIVAIDCHAAGPGCIEVLDSEGRPSGFDCSSWLEQLEVLGAAAVILRPRANVPSEGLLHIVRNRSCTVYIERTGWAPELVQALGAEGVVVQGALGTHQYFDLVASQVCCDIAG